MSVIILKEVVIHAGEEGGLIRLAGIRVRWGGSFMRIALRSPGGERRLLNSRWGFTTSGKRAKCVGTRKALQLAVGLRVIVSYPKKKGEKNAREGWC